MHVVLIILKVIGITLLILLGLILLLVFLLLVAPFRYRIDASYYDDIKATARIRWLFFVLDVKGLYENQSFLYYLKSFGFTVSTNDENDKHYRPLPTGKEAKEDFTAVPTTLLPDMDEEFEAFEKGRESEIHETKKIEENQIASEPSSEESALFEKNREESSLPMKKEESENLPVEKTEESPYYEENSGWNYPISTKFQQIMGWISEVPEKLHRGFETVLTKIHTGISTAFTKVQEFFEKLNEKLSVIPEKIHEKIGEITYKILDFLANIKENIKEILRKKNIIQKKLRMIKKFLEKESTKKTWKNLKKFILKVIKHVKPRKYRGKIRFGTSDPATTGQMLGGIGMLMPLYRGNLKVMPDFNEEVFEGEIYVKGRVQIGVLAFLAIRYLLNRNMFITIKCVRKIIGK